MGDLDRTQGVEQMPSHSFKSGEEIRYCEHRLQCGQYVLSKGKDIHGKPQPLEILESLEIPLVG